MRFQEDNGVLYEQQGPVRWRCEGCGFRLDLPASIAPPMWHTLDRPMGTPPAKFPDCPKVNWIKLGERQNSAPVVAYNANIADLDAEIDAADTDEDR